MFICYVLLFLLLVESVPSSTAAPAAGYCHTWDGEPSVCQSYAGLEAGMQIFVPENRTWEEIRGGVISFTGGNGATSIPQACQISSVDMACRTYIRPCVVDPVTNETIVHPVQPCRDICQAFTEACASTWERFGAPLGYGLFFPGGDAQLPMDCGEIDPATNASFYQNTTYRVATGAEADESVVAQCGGAQRTVNASACVSPLVPASENSVRCGFECPLPSLDDEQYHAVKVLQSVLGWLSWITSLFLVVTYAIDPKLRRWPSNLITMVALSAHMAAWAIIFPSFVGHENVWCSLNGDVAVPDMTVTYDPDASLTGQSYQVEWDLAFKSPVCTLQGGLLMFGFLAGTCWWALIALNMFLQLFFKERLPNSNKFTRWQQFAFHTIGWGLPLICAFVCMVADRIAFASAATFCFVSNEDDAVYLGIFWLAPVCLLLVLGLVFFVCSIARILYLGIKEGSCKKLMFMYYRIALFVFVFLAVYCFIFAYSIQVEANEDTIKEGYNDYYVCLIYEKPIEGCSLSQDVTNYGLVLIRSIGYSGLGLFLFLTFMTLDWRRVYSRLWQSMKTATKASSSRSKKKSDNKMTIEDPSALESD
ncbi:Frizzled/Smoothened membrane region [Balamuthia mandrillaris]